MNKVETSLKLAIINSFKKAFELELIIDDVVIEIPKDKKLGDYSTNTAMRFAKQLQKNPRTIAEILIENLDYEQGLIEKAEIAGPGFINFVMKKGSLGSIINEAITLNKKFGESSSENKNVINVEYISANPTGDLHLGHARGAAWGDSLTRILKKAGYNVIREFYMNDSGNQVYNLGLSVAARYAQLYDIPKEIPVDGYLGEDVVAIAKIIKEKYGDKFLSTLDNPNTIQELSELGVYYEMEKMRQDLALFRVEFDVFGSEKKLRDLKIVDKMFEELIATNNTYEQDGAVFFKTTKYGDDKDRVIRKSDGSYTYLMPDIAYHQSKIRGDINRIGAGTNEEKAQIPADILIDLLGGDHHGYIPRIKASLQAFGYNKDALEIDIIQMVRLIDSDGIEIKMSKRTGNAIKLRDFCREVGVDSVRYFYVSRALDTPFDFDVTLAKKQSNDNPVYYIQYAHARICSILKNIEVEMQENYDLLVEEKEIKLLQSLNEFTSTIAEIAKERTVHKLCNYTYKLAQQFHSFYGAHKVIDRNNPELTKQRLALMLAVKITIANALELIGVEAKEVM